MMTMQRGGQKDIDISIFRHLILNRLRAIRVKYRHQYGELVLCCDDQHHWRKDVFPYYKAHRRKDRESTGLNWPHFFSLLDDLKIDLMSYFPYRLIQIKGAEADDVIAALCNKYGAYGIRSADDESILIVSADKDFQQLQKYANVEQYDPIRNRVIKTRSPEKFLREHIIRGDRGDGIPNFLSMDDVFVRDDKRQPPIKTVDLNTWLNQSPEEFCNKDTLKWYNRNKELIDLDCVPENLQQEAVRKYNEDPVCKDRRFVRKYFIKNRMGNLLDKVSEF